MDISLVTKGEIFLFIFRSDYFIIKMYNPYILPGAYQILLIRKKKIKKWKLNINSSDSPIVSRFFI